MGGSGFYCNGGTVESADRTGIHGFYFRGNRGANGDLSFTFMPFREFRAVFREFRGSAVPLCGRVAPMPLLLGDDRGPPGEPALQAHRQAIATAVLLLGCASQPGPAPTQAPHAERVPGAAPDAAPCVVADTSAPSRDTLYTIGLESPRTDTRSLDCEGRPLPALDAPALVALTLAPGTDLRDVLDRGLPASGGPRPDVVVTRDPDVLAYATRRADYLVSPLGWNRTYVLVDARAETAAVVPPAEARDALARDAVSADARGAAAPFPWLSDPACFAPGPEPGGAARSVVAYATDDAIARQLAERIVALAAAPERPGWIPAALARTGGGPARVLPVPGDSIPAVLAAGRATAAIIALARDPGAACGTPQAPMPGRGAPLVDSRAHAIIRRGSGATAIIGADGTLRFRRRGAP